MDDDVLMEVVTIGNAVQVRAIRASTGLEVAFTARASASRRDLETLAIKKLAYVEARVRPSPLFKPDGDKEKRPDQRSGPKGIVI